MTRRTDADACVIQCCNLRFSCIRYGNDNDDVEQRFPDTRLTINFTQSLRKMGYFPLTKIFTSFRFMPSVIQEKQETFSYSSQPKKSKMFMRARQKG